MASTRFHGKMWKHLPQATKGIVPFWSGLCLLQHQQRMFITYLFLLSGAYRCSFDQTHNSSVWFRLLTYLLLRAIRGHITFQWLCSQTDLLWQPLWRSSHVCWYHEYEIRWTILGILPNFTDVKATQATVTQYLQNTFGTNIFWTSIALCLWLALLWNARCWILLASSFFGSGD